MAKNDNLTDFLRGIADRLRALLGTADPINPQDFEDKIQGVYDKGFSEGGPTGITATAADVLSGKVFGSGGSAVATGTMKKVTNNTWTTTNRSLESGYLVMIPTYGAYVDTTTKIRCAQANVASTIGLTAAKLLKGQSVLGITGTGVSTPAQIGVKPFLYYTLDDYLGDKDISVGTSPSNGTIRLFYEAMSSAPRTDAVEYFKSGSRQVSSPNWTRAQWGYIEVQTVKGEAISFRLRRYGNNSLGYVAFVYFTSVS